MDRAGRRPILMSGAAAMALFLTLTGYWIYIDQAYTPNAGTSTQLPGPRMPKLTESGHLRNYLQCRIRNVMGPCTMAVSSRDHAFAIQSKGGLVVDRHQLALCALPLCQDVRSWANDRITGSVYPLLFSRN